MVLQKKGINLFLFFIGLDIYIGHLIMYDSMVVVGRDGKHVLKL